ncbi:MAG: C40 family peptidase [Anaerolineae bacterium]|nr:C40 family peptidase [Anaerolineae bacterium]
MLEDIQTTLTDFSQQDSRLYYCQLDADRLENNHCMLSGVILDMDALAHVQEVLQARFPTVTFATNNVRVLSRPGQKKLTVSTNVTSLMSEPSWRSEQMSQVFNGWQVEILLDQESWVFVRQDRDGGYLGWVYRDFLVDEPAPEVTHLVYEPVSVLFAEPSVEASLVGRVVIGMVVAVTAVQDGWAQLSLAGGLTGWLPQNHVRSINDIPQSESERRQQIIKSARLLTGVPYQWGSRTALGIDCSGLAELCCRLSGISIPRDADMQFNAGRGIEPPFQAGDLLFFGSERGHRSVSHVGISLGGWDMIHASRSRNGVHEDNVQAEPWLRDIFLGARSFF